MLNASRQPPTGGRAPAEPAATIQIVRRRKVLPGVFVLITFAAAVGGAWSALARPGTLAGIGLLAVAALSAVAGWLALGAPVNRRGIKPHA